MNKNNPAINIDFRQDKEIPEIVGDMYFDIHDVEEIKLTKGDPILATVTLEYQEDEKRILDEYYFVLGTIEPASRVLEFPDEYGLFYPQDFVNKCPIGKMVTYTTPAGHKRVGPYDSRVHVFEESSDMVAAALDFVSSCLEIRNQFAAGNKKMCKTNGNN